MRADAITGLAAAMGMALALAGCGSPPQTSALPDWPSPAAVDGINGAGDDGSQTPVHFQLIRAGTVPAGRLQQVIGDERAAQLLDGAG